jgi:hypothetical protein
VPEFPYHIYIALPTYLPDTSKMFQKHFRLGSNERLSPQHFYNIEYFYAVGIINILSQGLCKTSEYIYSLLAAVTVIRRLSRCKRTTDEITTRG